MVVHENFTNTNYVHDLFQNLSVYLIRGFLLIYLYRCALKFIYIIISLRWYKIEIEIEDEKISSDEEWQMLVS